MKAAVHERYGSPDAVVEIRELDKPEPADDEVLVRVQASSVNIAEWYGVTGRPWIARPTTGLRGPKDIRLGVDYAGIVESVGKDVTDFRAGDEVFGGRSGAWAEYVCVRAERAIVTKPGNVTFEHAGAVGTAAITALQALRDKGGLVPGQKVLINGASGGVGTYAVQIAKALGAEVTAVCSTPNVEIARSLGADVVIDYRVEDVTQEQRTLRPRARHRRDAFVRRAAAGARARCDGRRGRRAEGEPLPRADRTPRRVTAPSASRKPAGNVLPGEVQQGGHGDAARISSRPGR